MDGEQIAVLLFLGASFLAGWFARGERSREGHGGSSDAASASLDKLLKEAGAFLEAAVPFARAAAGDAPEESAVGLAALRRTLEALDSIDERLDPFPGFALYEALDCALNELALLDRALAPRQLPSAGRRRRVEEALGALAAAQARYSRAWSTYVGRDKVAVPDVETRLR